jgi:hypothetical protein
MASMDTWLPRPFARAGPPGPGPGSAAAPPDGTARDLRREAEQLTATWAEAESRLDAATARLLRAEEATLAGAPPDDVAFDALLREYCEARLEALAARSAWHRWQDGRRLDAARSLIAPTARLRFARWLYLHGRIAG